MPWSPIFRKVHVLLFSAYNLKPIQCCYVVFSEFFFGVPTAGFQTHTIEYFGIKIIVTLRTSSGSLHESNEFENCLTFFQVSCPKHFFLWFTNHSQQILLGATMSCKKTSGQMELVLTDIQLSLGLNNLIFVILLLLLRYYAV